MGDLFGAPEVPAASDRRATVEAWIAARRAEGCWITACPSCGCLFAQLHVGRRGRRSSVCDWHRCVLWHRYRNHYGRAPPAWLMEKWRAVYGDTPAPEHQKRHLYPRAGAVPPTPRASPPGGEEEPRCA